jgi:hypothetical protein
VATVQGPSGIGWAFGVLVTQVPWPAPPPLHHSVARQFASTLHVVPQVPVRYVSQTGPLCGLRLAVSLHWLELVQVPHEPSGAHQGAPARVQACGAAVPKSPSQATQLSKEPLVVEQTGDVAPQAVAWPPVHSTHVNRFTEPAAESQTPVGPVQAAVLPGTHCTQVLDAGSQTAVAPPQLASRLQAMQRPELGPEVTQRSPGRH